MKRAVSRPKHTSTSIATANSRSRKSLSSCSVFLNSVMLLRRSNRTVIVAIDRASLRREQQPCHQRPQQRADKALTEVIPMREFSADHQTHKQLHGLRQQHQRQDMQRLRTDREPQHAAVDHDRKIRQQRISQRVLAEQCGFVDVHQQAHHEGDADTDLARLMDGPEHQYQRDEIRNADPLAPRQQIQQKSRDQTERDEKRIRRQQDVMWIVHRVLLAGCVAAGAADVAAAAAGLAVAGAVGVAAAGFAAGAAAVAAGAAAAGAAVSACPLRSSLGASLAGTASPSFALSRKRRLSSLSALSAPSGSGRGATVCSTSKISSCLWRSTPAAGRQTMCAKASVDLVSTCSTLATAKPGGYTPSIPEVTSASPFWMSALAAMKRRSSTPDWPRP